MDIQRKWLVVATIVLTALFGQDIALAIVTPIVTVLGSVIPAV